MAVVHASINYIYPGCARLQEFLGNTCRKDVVSENHGSTVSCRVQGSFGGYKLHSLNTDICERADLCKYGINYKFLNLNYRRGEARTSRNVLHGSRGYSGNEFDGEEWGPYPWEKDPVRKPDDDDVVDEEEVITLLTSEGLVRLNSSRNTPWIDRRGKVPKLRFREEDYMNPHQQLCLGALFDIAATNGLDRGRRVCVLGFCRSVEMLHDCVENSVRNQGGEVVIAEQVRQDGLHEKLRLTVAIPLLWGVPPAMDTLSYAIRSGGGIVDKVYRQWEFL